ncbi:MAG: beta-propeller fold lactonase family protein [Burkholderiales bacterium]
MKTNSVSTFYFIKRAIRTVAISAVALVTSAAATVTIADAGVVYTLTNAAAGNSVAVFNRAGDGTLSAGGQVATTGLGSGGGLGSQGALVLSKNGRWLFAVNAGSNDVSVFSAGPGGLTLASKTPSGGTRPVSLTVHDDVLYVLNGGGVNNISGFRINDNGTLQPIAGSTRPLSATSTAPAQIEFNRDGDQLVVTEKATDKISLYSVENGVAAGPVVRNSVGMTPFGFAFDKRGHLIVSEAFGGGAGLSALTSYNLEEELNELQTISPSVKDNQSAACWVVTTKNGKWAYTSNTASGNISGYDTAKNGRLSLFNDNGITGVTGANPTDMALSRNSQYLYVITPANGILNAFKIGANGGLSAITGGNGLPASAVGLAAR